MELVAETKNVIQPEQKDDRNIIKKELKKEDLPEEPKKENEEKNILEPENKKEENEIQTIDKN